MNIEQPVIVKLVFVNQETGQEASTILNEAHPDALYEVIEMIEEMIDIRIAKQRLNEYNPKISLEDAIQELDLEDKLNDHTKI